MGFLKPKTPPLPPEPPPPPLTPTRADAGQQDLTRSNAGAIGRQSFITSTLARKAKTTGKRTLIGGA